MRTFIVTDKRKKQQQRLAKRELINAKKTAADPSY